MYLCMYANIHKKRDKKAKEDKKGGIKMKVKAVFVIDTEASDPVDAIESNIENIFSNGESIRDYAWIYTREDDSEIWGEVSE